MVLKVGYVPEHFSSPLLQLAKEDAGKTFELVKCPAGTGEMIARLTDGSIDVSIALTESLIAGIVKGSKAYKMIGSYVSSPLNWAIITGKETKFNSVADLRGQKIGVSRIGSGSQVMAKVLAIQQGWTKENGEPEELQFEVQETFTRLRESVNDGTTAFFMWEHFTTKPYTHPSSSPDHHQIRFIGSLPTPWPSWAIAASTSLLSQPDSHATLRTFLGSLEDKVRAFDSEEKRADESEEGDVRFVEREFGYEREDVKSWLGGTRWFGKLEGMDKKMIRGTLDTLAKAGAVQKPESGEWKIDGEILVALD